MPSEKDSNLEFDQYMKSDKTSYIICDDIALLIRKIYGYANNPEKSSTTENINYQKVRDHFHYTGKYRGAAHNVCSLKFNVPNEIPVVFHRVSNSDYHFIIQELANEFEGQFECLGENKEKYETFSIPKKSKKKKKKGKERNYTN